MNGPNEDTPLKAIKLYSKGLMKINIVFCERLKTKINGVKPGSVRKWSSHRSLGEAVDVYLKEIPNREKESNRSMFKQRDQAIKELKETVGISTNSFKTLSPKGAVKHDKDAWTPPKHYEKATPSVIGDSDGSIKGRSLSKIAGGIMCGLCDKLIEFPEKVRISGRMGASITGHDKCIDEFYAGLDKKKKIIGIKT